MTDTPLLPFDALRPFKGKPEDFTPRDTLPWERLAANVLQCGPPERGFGCLSPAAVVEGNITWLMNNLSLPSGGMVLDIGCGPGLYSNGLAQHGYQVTGIDIAQPFLAYAQAQAESQGWSCTYLNRSMFALNFEGEFDLILLINSVARRLTVEELHPLLRQINQALKPGGHLIGEFSVLPSDFETKPPTVNEMVAFYQKSPWSTQFHAWMIRELAFPETRERVTHHLVLEPDGHPQEYWSRFTLHPQSILTAALAGGGFRIKTYFGQMLGQAYQSDQCSCFVWAVSS